MGGMDLISSIQKIEVFFFFLGSGLNPCAIGWRTADHTDGVAKPVPFGRRELFPSTKLCQNQTCDLDDQAIGIKQNAVWRNGADFIPRIAFIGFEIFRREAEWDGRDRLQSFFRTGAKTSLENF